MRRASRSVLGCGTRIPRRRRDSGLFPWSGCELAPRLHVRQSVVGCLAALRMAPRSSSHPPATPTTGSLASVRAKAAAGAFVEQSPVDRGRSGETPQGPDDPLRTLRQSGHAAGRFEGTQVEQLDVFGARSRRYCPYPEPGTGRGAAGAYQRDAVPHVNVVECLAGCWLAYSVWFSRGGGAALELLIETWPTRRATPIPH